MTIRQLTSNTPRGVSRWAVIGGIGSLIFFSGCSKVQTTLKPLDMSGPAQKYLTEFSGFDFQKPKRKESPNGTARIEVTTSGWLPFNQSCHTISLTRKDGTQLHILTARESDPGSGRSFLFGWASDSKAVFISGRHSGLDCIGMGSADLNVIFTLDDMTAWSVPLKYRIEKR